jgi:hypothetical protein
VDPVPDPLLLRKCGRAGNRTRDLWICSQKLWPLDHRGSQRIVTISFYYTLMICLIWYNFSWKVQAECSPTESFIFERRTVWNRLYVAQGIFICLFTECKLYLRLFAYKEKLCLKYSAVQLLHENTIRVITVFVSWLNISWLTTKDISTNYSRLNIHTYSRARRSQWPRGLRHELSSLTRTLGSWFRIPLEAWMSVFILCLC